MLPIDPPRLQLDSNVTWVLARALSDAAATLLRVDGARALGLARRFGLSARIGARHGQELLTAELGRATALEFRTDTEVAAARGALLGQSAGLVSEIASRHGVPLIALKFAALSAGGYVGAGMRDATDIDVLVPSSAARSLHRILRGRGYVESQAGPRSHHLAPLLDPYGVPVEIHIAVPGVLLPGSTRFARGDELIDAGLTSAAGALLVPTAGFLTAHAIAHALLQNYAQPRAHVTVRVLADLHDLLARSPTALESAARFLVADVSKDDLKMILQTCESLETWQPPDAAPGESRLLRHLLGGELDDAYEAKLRLTLLTHPFGELTGVARHAASLRQALFPSTPTLARLLGTRTPGGLLLGRVLRPIDLLGRFGKAWLRAKRRI